MAGDRAAAPGPAADPALDTLHRYYEALARKDVGRGLACFADPCEYRHPPFAYGGELPNRWTEEGTGFVLGRNHDDLRGIWELMWSSGLENPYFVVTGFARSGELCFSEGYGGLGQPREPGAGAHTVTWLAGFTVDDDNRIVKYLPYRSIPPLPLLGATGLAVAAF